MMENDIYGKHIYLLGTLSFIPSEGIYYIYRFLQSKYNRPLKNIQVDKGMMLIPKQEKVNSVTQSLWNSLEELARQVKSKTSVTECFLLAHLDNIASACLSIRKLI